jgi:hypothetical protein
MKNDLILFSQLPPLLLRYRSSRLHIRCHSGEVMYLVSPFYALAAAKIIRQFIGSLIKRNISQAAIFIFEGDAVRIFPDSL